MVYLISDKERSGNLDVSKKPYGTVLIRAAKIMDYLSNSSESKCLKEIAEQTDMTTSTTLKILDTLVLIGYVTRDNTTKEYTLGPSLVKYANKYINDSVLVKAASPYLEELHDSVDETIHLGIYSGDEVMYLTKLEPKKQSIYMTSKVGSTRPLYSSAMGKAILSELPEEEVKSYLNRTDLVPYTPNTITNSLALLEELKIVSERSVAFDDEEMEKDCFCIGTSIDLGDNMYGAFSVSMPKFRINDEVIASLTHQINDTKKKIEQKIQEG
ncbi:IclR family transcriptional regulator [Vagococcus proximus]|uniref:IclR family transcriptional regulator n=1 Tax=Vagococcus proximus TaxID=2991417 RepID=UPI0023B87B0F|nr:IclR family transcriptional regulator [Vagococcus proximus]